MPSIFTRCIQTHVTKSVDSVQLKQTDGKVKDHGDNIIAWHFPLRCAENSSSSLILNQNSQKEKNLQANDKKGVGDQATRIREDSFATMWFFVRRC